MNPRLDLLQPYPFERLRLLTQDLSPPANHSPISLGLGEPRHATPPLIREALVQALNGLARYPATAGEPALRRACATWASHRYGITLNADTQVLPVCGSREALFALTQAVVDAQAHATTGGPLVVCPNPFYQIYEGAALLAGAGVAYVNSDPARNFAVDWSAVPAATWARTELLFVCSPGNPTGAVMSLDEWARLFELSDQHGFVIASDECYSEIYFRDEAPLGGLAAAARLGRTDFRNLVMLTSLSKRSNVPGLRSGFVAGDAHILKRFLLYRTYHGSAMSPVVQQASIAAWSDEAHVQHNRELYRRKFEAVTPLLAPVLDVRTPDAGFYLWAGVPERFARGLDANGPQASLSSDCVFARDLLAQYNVAVLPGSFLARTAQGHNPGAGRVRMALVAEFDECVEAAQRIVSFMRTSP